MEIWYFPRNPLWSSKCAIYFSTLKTTQDSKWGSFPCQQH